MKNKIPDDFELDKENSTDDKLVFIKKKNKYPIHDYEIVGTKIKTINLYDRLEENPSVNIITSDLTEAKKIYCLFKLIRFRDAWNEIDGFVPDWSNKNQKKHTISSYDIASMSSNTHYTNKILCFGSEETRDLFLDIFENLIEMANDYL